MTHNAIASGGLASLALVGTVNSTLKHLKLGSNNIELLEGFNWRSFVSPRLRSLDLSSNTICGRRIDGTFDPTAVFELAQLLETSNRSLTQLNLSRNDIGARATKKLLDALKENDVLHTLILDHCNITEHGALHFAKTLPKLTGLKKLVVSDCSLGPEGCKVCFWPLSVLYLRCLPQGRPPCPCNLLAHF